MAGTNFDFALDPETLERISEDPAHELNFIYEDARKQVSLRRITDVSHNEKYLQGHCHLREELRTFRKSRIKHVLTGDESDEQIEERLRAYEEDAASRARASPEPGQYSVCFTGFKKDTKEELASASTSVGFFVRKGVTNDLDFLCFGYNAGPKKLQKARSQGVVILDEPQFRQLLETGEVPE